MLMEMKMVVVIDKQIPISEPKPLEIQIEDLEVVTNDYIRNEDKKILQCNDLARLNKPFITKNHFRDINNRSCVVAFELIPNKSGENIDDFTIFYGIDEETLKQRELIRVGNLFIDKPIVKYSKGTILWQITEFENEPTTGTLGYVHPGYTKLFLKKKNHRELYDYERLLLVLPSSLSVKQLEVMIKEIMYFRRKLLSLDKKYINDAKAYFSFENDKTTDINWEMQLKWIKNCLAQIEPYLQRINDLPKKNLKTVKGTKSYNQIKKITPSIVKQYIQNNDRRKFHAEESQNSLDIFEHRLIKCKLLELKKFVEFQNAQNLQNIEEERIAIVNKMAQLVDEQYNYSNEIKIEDIKTKWEEYTRKAENNIKTAKYEAAKNFSKEFLKKKIVKFLGPIWCSFAKMDLELRHVNFKSMDFGGGFLRVAFNCSNISENIAGSFWYDSENRVKQLIDEFAFYSEDPCVLVAFLEGMLKHSEENDNVTEKLIKIKTEGLISYNGVSKRKYLTLYKIDKMVINGEELMISSDKMGSLSKLKAFYVDTKYSNNKDIDKLNGDKKNIIGLESSLKKSDNSLTQNLRYYLKFVIKRVDKLLKLPVFGNVHERASEPWRITQIFTNDYNYHQVYRRLYLLDKICDFSFSGNGDKILHEKIDRLYEYWILIKILEHLLIRQNWVTTEGGQDVSEVFNYIFSKNKHKNFEKICLKHNGDDSHGTLILELYYDTELKVSLHDLIKQQENNTEKLRPDFLFRVKNERNGDEKIFILDVKYRNYEEQGRYWWTHLDLTGVCAAKYISRVEKDLGIKKISTAFIVHPDMTHGNRMNSSNKYLGKYVTFNVFANNKIGIPILDGKDGSECQIGSFYMTPFVNNEYNQSSDNLNTYFEMMFEYFMGEWKTCWRCGSNSVEVTTLLTAGNKQKYHMSCNQCNSFWVKSHDYSCGETIIKHLINYHIEEDYGSTWKLQCPTCESERLANRVKGRKK